MSNTRKSLTVDALHEIIDSIPVPEGGDEFVVALVDETGWKVQRIKGVYVNETPGERMLVITYES